MELNASRSNKASIDVEFVILAPEAEVLPILLFLALPNLTGSKGTSMPEL